MEFYRHAISLPISQRSENERCYAFIINLRAIPMFSKHFWPFLLLAIVPLLGIKLARTASRTEIKTTDLCITANIFCRWNPIQAEESIIWSNKKSQIWNIFETGYFQEPMLVSPFSLGCLSCLAYRANFTVCYRKSYLY